MFSWKNKCFNFFSLKILNNNVGNSVYFSKVHCLYCNDGWQGSVYLFQVKVYVTYCDLYLGFVGDWWTSSKGHQKCGKLRL